MFLKGVSTVTALPIASDDQADTDSMQQPRFIDYLDLAAAPTAIPCARMFIEATLIKWRAIGILEQALKVTTELVTKAVRASDEMDLIKIGLVGLEASIVIGVWDNDLYPPDLPEPGDTELKPGSYSADRGRVIPTRPSTMSTACVCG
ncbi:MAG: hypothetical protein ACRDQ5_16105 [Sciscionella sp.]